jgi:molecular chaperone GrpE
MTAEPQKPDPDNQSSEQAQAAASAVLDDIESLRARALERDQYLSLLQRTQADFENYQKRNQRERDLERRFAHFGFARELLTALDNLDRATAAAQQAKESGPLVQGVAMVQNQLLELMRRHGITPIEALGKTFDPNLHQAVMQEPTDAAPPNTVTKVLERGFMIYDRVLRPAHVVVSTSPGSGK